MTGADGTILIEGWRFVPHSYGIVNHWQCLELLRRGCPIAMHDVPYLRKWWKPVRGLHGEAVERQLAAIGPLPPGERARCVLRLSIPYRFQASPHGPVAVMCTADCGWMPRLAIDGYVPLEQAHAESDALLITPSRWSQWGILRSGADPDRTFVVPLGVDTSLFHPVDPERRAELRRELGWEGKFVFLNVSAMTENKGTVLLLSGFAAAARANPDALLVLKGLNELYKSSKLIAEALRKLGVDAESACRGRIAYVGQSMTFHLMSCLYQAADVYVSPYFSESFNLPVLEATASGLPVICTAGGPTDEFTTAETAWRIESKMSPRQGRANRDSEEVVLVPSVEQLRTLMVRAMEDRSLDDSARQHGPALARSKFTWRHAVDGLLAVIDRQIGRPP